MKRRPFHIMRYKYNCLAALYVIKTTIKHLVYLDSLILMNSKFTIVSAIEREDIDEPVNYLNSYYL